MSPYKQRKTYPPETEAGWYVIKEFISLLLCSYKSDNGALPFNPNEVLNHHFSKTGVFELNRYSKAKYHRHICQIENHYYRSNHNSRHTTGFHRSDKIAQQSILYKILDISIKKTKYGDYYVILCMIDIDGHQGENDCEKVAQWLNTTYFHQSYWEPSTSFTGQHGYIKIAIPLTTPIEEVHTTLTTLFKYLDIKRVLSGFSAPIDIPCGLPSIVSWDNTIEIPKKLPKVTRQEYRDFRALRYRINELTKNKQEDLLHELPLQISHHHQYDDILKIVNTPVPASIKSAQCGKLPRFNRTHPDHPSLEDIKFFYHLEYYSFSYFVELLETLKKDPEIVSYIPKVSSHSPAPSPAENISVDNTPSPYDIPIIHKNETVDTFETTNSHFHSDLDLDLDISSNSSDLLPASLSAHSISFPCQEKNVVAKNDNLIISPTITIRNYCLGKMGLEPKNEVFDDENIIENEEKEKNEYLSNDANQRTGQYIGKYLRDYYKANHTLPKIEEVQDMICSEYRKKYGTGEEDKYDRKRIISMLEKQIKTFKPEKMVLVKYEKLMFIPYIRETFHKEEYQNILSNTAAQKCRPNHIKLDLYAGYIYTHLSRNKELTLSSYDGFIKFCEQYKVKVDDHTCLACRLLFEYYGWLEKIDANYATPTYENGKKRNGKAMAYTLTEQFPFYAEFEKSVGQKNIEKVRTKGLTSMQDWENMENAG